MRVEESDYNRRPFESNRKPSVVNSNVRIVYSSFVEIRPDALKLKSTENHRSLCWRINDEIFLKYNGRIVHNRLDENDSYYEYSVTSKSKPFRIKL
jgi:hypothetical protein